MMPRLRMLPLFLAICILQGCSFTREISPSPTKEILQPAGHQRSAVSPEAVEPAVPSSDMGSIPPLFEKHQPAQEPSFSFHEETPYEIDFEMNERVQWWIRQYTGPHRTHFLNTLARFDSLCPVMEQIFESYGLPKDLVYLSMVESGGVATAVSRTGATGYWQFMTSTAIHYDLKVGRWIDERRDLEKSTHAAARYLKNLYSYFGDWLLAGAAYNAGEGTISRIMKNHSGVSSFWDISRPMPIKTETLEYIPKFIATLVLAKNRDLYKLNIPEECRIAPLEYDTVTVRGFAYLDEVAQIAGVPCSHLVRLNPELIRQCTPPGAVDYALKVPKGTAQRVADHLHKAYDPQVEYVTHTIQKGDTLIGIGRKYSTTARDIAKANRMETNEVLSIGRTLVVPKGTAAARPRPVDRHRHVVAKGESLGSISRRYGVSLEDLVAVNSISNPSLIQPGTVLNIPPKLTASSGRIPVQYRVKKGDTIWGISQRFEVSANDVILWNRLTPSAMIQPGDEITIYR
ncbi:MAG: LysM peptidoglycan-binding domain-containing protein [Desulfomonilia bacterium]